MLIELLCSDCSYAEWTKGSKEATPTIEILSFCLAIVIMRYKESNQPQFSAQMLSDEVNGYAWGDTANFCVNSVALSHSFAEFYRFLDDKNGMGIISIQGNHMFDQVSQSMFLSEQLLNESGVNNAARVTSDMLRELHYGIDEKGIEVPTKHRNYYLKHINGHVITSKYKAWNDTVRMMMWLELILGPIIARHQKSLLWSDNCGVLSSI